MVAAFAVVWLSLPAMSPVSPVTPVNSVNCTPLQVAVIRGDQDTVQRLAGRRLLGMGAPAAQLEERGEAGGACYRRTALMLAAEHGNLMSAQVLISSGAKLDATAFIPELGEAEIDARCLAVANSRELLIVALDKAGAGTLPCIENARLFAALNAGNVEAVQRQLRANLSPATIKAALLSIIGRRSGRKLDLLVQAGLELKLDFAPVYDAALLAGDVDTVRQLSAAGAKVEGANALSQAISLRQAAAISSLLAAGARTDTPEARDAILEAVREQQGPVLRMLLSAGYRGDDETPLLLLAIRNFPGIVHEMVIAGVGIEIDDEAGATPLMAAAAADDPDLVEWLIERGASPRTGDLVCETAIDASRSPKVLKRQLMQKLLSPVDPRVLPGRAARRMGITCGTARLSITYNPDYQVFISGALEPMRPAMEHHVEPGLLELRVRKLSTNSERKVTVRLLNGFNSFGDRIFESSGTLSADPDVLAGPLSGRFPVTAKRSGRFACDSKPPGAQVWIDGKNTGKVTPVPLSNALVLSPGKHTVVFQLNGVASGPHAVTVSADQISVLKGVEIRGAN